jgi:hypothetical protein
MDDAASWRAPMDDVRAAEMDGVRVAEIDDFGVMDGQLGRGSAMGGQVRGSRRHFLLRSVRVESGRGFVAGREIDRGLFKKIANRCGQPGEFRAVSRIHSQRFNVYVHILPCALDMLNYLAICRCKCPAAPILVINRL